MAATDETTPKRLDLDAFIARFQEALPTPEPIGPETRIAELGHDHVGRSLARAVLRSLLPGAPPELLASIDTVGDAHAWHVSRAEGTDPTVPARPRVRLRVLEDGDLPALYRASCDPQQGFRWRYRGATPSPQEFRAQLHAGVLAQFVVEGIDDGRAHGLVCAYDARFEERRASIALVRIGTPVDGGEVLEGLALFIDHLFATWDLRKLQAEVPGFNADSLVDPLSPFLTVEGRLVDSCFAQGRAWDLLIIAIWRDVWARERHRIPFLGPLPLG
jgi:hypothetical protein